MADGHQDFKPGLESFTALEPESPHITLLRRRDRSHSY